MPPTLVGLFLTTEPPGKPIYIYIYIYIYITSFQDFIPGLVTTEHQVGFPVLYSRLSPAIIYICSSVHMESQSPSSPTPWPFPTGIHALVLFVCLSISVLQIRSSLSFS